MPKPATVEDEEPSPVSPVDDKPVLPDIPVFQGFKMPGDAPEVPEVPEALEAPESSSTVSYSENTIYPGSVAEIQRGFEELLINQPRSSTTSTTSVPPMAPCCSQFKREVPSMFHHKEAPRMNNCSSTEIPVTRGTAARDKWFAELAGLSNDRQQSRPSTNGPSAPVPTVSIFSVYCNNCSEAIPDEHYHCSTCDDGDFDLCQTCVNDGVLCGGEDHWMIKRFVKNGKVINSTTETIAPKPTPSEPKAAPSIPEDLEVPVATRTCNSCIQGELLERLGSARALLISFTRTV
jgi:next-to-BRCA1 protein 1